MAFEGVKGQKVYSAATGQTFIFADYFTVFPGSNTVPYIYEWNDIESITENNNGLIISTENSTFTIERAAFSSNIQYLAVRAIIEGQIATHSDIHYKFNKRILPLKYLYQNMPVGSDAYVLRGIYSEKDINSCNISLVSTKVGKYIFLLAILIAGFLFFLLNMIIGNLEDNWVYFIPISVFTGIIISVVIYLIIAIIARHKHSAIAKVDPAILEEITVAVTPDGFAATESAVYTGQDLVPWAEASYYIETHSGFVIIRDNKSVFWLPRSFIPKDVQNAVGNLIAARVKQK